MLLVKGSSPASLNVDVAMPKNMTHHAIPIQSYTSQCFQSHIICIPPQGRCYSRAQPPYHHVENVHDIATIIQMTGEVITARSCPKDMPHQQGRLYRLYVV